MIKSAKTTYELSVQQLREMFAKELGVEIYKVLVSDREMTVGIGNGETQVFAGLTVVVDHDARGPRDARD